MSNIGRPCERQLWYEINIPAVATPLRPENYMKFMFGHLVEELVLFLAELAGHDVKGRQDEAEISGIKGHRDAVVDGAVIDVKSASTYSFKKFVSGGLKEDDPFGYIPQIQSYLHDAQNDPIVTEKDRAAFLVLDKTLGHLTLDVHERDTETDWPELFEQKKAMVQQAEPPDRGYALVPYGSSGNMALPVACSYCPFKKTCYPELRTFLYANRPVDLAVVVKTPLVPELKEDQNNGDDTDGT